jgi:hypothetical protein
MKWRVFPALFQNKIDLVSKASIGDDRRWNSRCQERGIWARLGQPPLLIFYRENWSHRIERSTYPRNTIKSLPLCEISLKG